MSSIAEAIRGGHPDDGVFRVYTTNYCGYCVAAKRLLVQYGFDFIEIDVTGDDAARMALAQASKQRTVPQIWHGARHIGGYSELVPYLSGRRAGE